MRMEAPQSADVRPKCATRRLRFHSNPRDGDYAVRRYETSGFDGLYQGGFDLLD